MKLSRYTVCVSGGCPTMSHPSLSDAVMVSPLTGTPLESETILTSRPPIPVTVHWVRKVSLELVDV